MAKDLTPERAAYFEELDGEKQGRFDQRISREILKLMGVKPVAISILSKMSEQEAHPALPFSPEWVSDMVGSPIIFRAVKDYEVNKEGGFPTPTQLLHKWLTGGRYRRSWYMLWGETLDRHKSTGKNLAACFRPCWAKETMVIHDYEPMLRTSNLGSGSLFWRSSEGNYIILSTLKTLVCTLLAVGWQPSAIADR